MSKAIEGGMINSSLLGWILVASSLTYPLIYQVSVTVSCSGLSEGPVVAPRSVRQ